MCVYVTLNYGFFVPGNDMIPYTASPVVAGDLGLSLFLGSVLNDEFYLGDTNTIVHYWGVVYHPVSFLSIEPGFFS